MNDKLSTTNFGQNWMNKNQLFRHLNRESLERLAPLLEPVNLQPQQVIYKPGAEVSEIYFPDNAVLCMLTIMEDGRSIEAVTVGSEGASWVSASLGSPTMPCQTMAAIGGRAHKIAARHVEEEVKRNGIFHGILSEYSHALLISSMRTGACNGLHSQTQRCARWMLSTLDRTSSPSFTITQEFLACLLGCTRPTLNQILGELEALDAIKQRRGSIEVVDRFALEKMTCECYRIIRGNFEQLEVRAAKVVSEGEGHQLGAQFQDFTD